MSTPEEQVYIAKEGVITKDGWKVIFSTAWDIFIRRINISVVRTVKYPDEESLIGDQAPMSAKSTGYEKLLLQMVDIFGDKSSIIRLEENEELFEGVRYRISWINPRGEKAEGDINISNQALLEFGLSDEETIQDALSTLLMDHCRKMKAKYDKDQGFVL